MIYDFSNKQVNKFDIGFYYEYKNGKTKNIITQILNL